MLVGMRERRPVAVRRSRTFLVQESEVFDADDAIEELRGRIATDIGSKRLEIPPFPRVAIELNRLANDPNADLKRAGRLIQRDAQLAGRVVKAACSPLYGRRPVSTLEEASLRLGLDGVRDVAMVAAMGRVFQGGPLIELVRSKLAHAFVVAAVTNKACRLLRLDHKIGFSCGLFHDAGWLLLAMALTEYGRDNPCLLEPDFVERAGAELHEATGRLLLSRWGLHETVKSIAQHHHNPAGAADNHALAWVVRVADIADDIEAEDSAERFAELRLHPEVRDCGIGEAVIQQMCETVALAREDETLGLVASR